MTSPLPNTIFIMGTTGSGKSSLALSLASTLGAEIVNADALQLYKSANIMTAKPSASEQSKVPHHLLDLCELSQTNFSRVSFVSLALQAISAIHSKGKTAIIVGGTHYYLESLIFDLQVDSDQKSRSRVLPSDSIDNYSNPLAPPAPSLHSGFLQVDPLFASKIHPNDSRRLLSYFFHFVSSGEKPSEVIKRNENPGIRFGSCLVIWKWKEMEELEKDLGERMEEMLKGGQTVVP